MSVVIDSTELRAAFNDIRPVFRGTEGSKVMAFTIDGPKLVITVNNGLVYQKEITAASSEYATLTVLYQDLTDLIPPHTTCKVSINKTNIQIESQTFIATLKQANSIVTRYEPRGRVYANVPREELTYAMKVFSNTSTLSRAFQSEAAIIFNSPDAVMKYPTVWIRVKNSFLNTVMGLREAKCLSSFGPEKFWDGEVMEFVKGNSMLVLSKNDPPKTDDFDKHLVGMKDLAIMKTMGLHKLTQDMMRGVGAGECNCYVYPNGVEIEVSKPDVHTSVISGEKTQSVYTIRTFLEFLLMFFAMANDNPYNVKAGGNKVCLYNNSLAILMYARD